MRTTRLMLVGIASAMLCAGFALHQGVAAQEAQPENKPTADAPKESTAGDPEAKPDETKPTETKPAETKPTEKTTDGDLPPLPPYYRYVISFEQREQIVAVQKKYKVQLDELKKKIIALDKQRDEELDALLSPAQKAKIKQLREEAAARKN